MPSYTHPEVIDLAEKWAASPKLLEEDLRTLLSCKGRELALKILALQEQLVGQKVIKLMDKLEKGAGADLERGQANILLGLLVSRRHNELAAEVVAGSRTAGEMDGAMSKDIKEKQEGIQRARLGRSGLAADCENEAGEVIYLLTAPEVWSSEAARARLRALASHKSKAVRIAVAAGMGLVPKRKEDREAFKKFAPDNLLQKMLEDSNTAVREVAYGASISRGNMGAEKILKGYEKLWVREGTLNIEIEREIASDPDPAQRERLAKNENTSPEVRLWLSKDARAEVRMAAAAFITDKEVLRSMLKDEDRDVRRQVLAQFSLKELAEETQADWTEDVRDAWLAAKMAEGQPLGKDEIRAGMLSENRHLRMETLKEVGRSGPKR